MGSGTEKYSVNAIYHSAFERQPEAFIFCYNHSKHPCCDKHGYNIIRRVVNVIGFILDRCHVWILVLRGNFWAKSIKTLAAPVQPAIFNVL